MIQDKRLLGGVAGAVLFAAVGGFTVARCTSDTPAATTETAAKGDEAQADAPADTITMTAAAIKDAGVVTETITAGGLGAEIISQAVVTPSPTGEAIVTARAGGAVTRVLKRLGDPVRAGEALAVVESRDAAQIAADRTAAGAKATLAQKALARESYLYDQKVSARVDLETAQAEAASAAAEARRAAVAAGAANITSDGRGVVLASPISGRVTAMKVSLGAYVQPETELFRVADPRQIQIEAAVGAADAARLEAGDKAIIELPDGRTVDARVRAVTPTLSGETRAATAVLDVTSSLLQPGLAVRVRMIPSRSVTSNAIVVPEEAVQSVGGRDVVFVRTANGFKATPVTTGQRSAGRIEIASGFPAGRAIATRNAFLLKAELGKGAGEEE
ncbi:MAG: efflux RND transporter periplasmic adaptor subunit [Sphingobium sp.]|jgi:cobalt-zinc-cadmium efflux system membrane fusion protein|uniref:efflux RND transporter periplasmic adaptor subunit n=1 Tax=Sphingobium sp. JS3065 TaxID=2970925 RepID=UPI0022649284|nr:efflux RND transporter periplasmic adaptor subunit [Sphingobium sp. JS3065]MCI1271483.1 efflux RND transporter periplasmic adaptor subunit [Sphingobium sp.]MCI1754365.1 efflux RND transporter periplasmic adaptor subunit [Sphingobium sp.]MCI2053938.1 efflux RND transporter periplasmic adaptor subunit [Sphingobium sp.]UZW56699.1 efflux RND transporter periplasmic adaptor subunit [Sphingobium sp. JS3065]